jgi:hypothetical protein
MSSIPPQFLSDFNARLEAIAGAVASIQKQLPAQSNGHSNGHGSADEIIAQIARQGQLTREDFAGKLASLINPYLERVVERCVDVERRQTDLEKKLIEHVTKYGQTLETHRAAIASILEAHEDAIGDLLASNDEKLTEQKENAGQVLKYLASYDKQLVDLYNGCLLLVKSNETTVETVKNVVGKFDDISNGQLEEVAKVAEETITKVSTKAKLEMEKMVVETRTQIEGTRKHYLKTLTGLDNRLLEHPIIFVLAMILMVSMGSGFVGVYLGRIGESRHTQQLVESAVDSISQKMEERMQRIDEQTKSLNNTFEEAQYWEALTNNMDYEQKMNYIKLAQQQAQKMGRKLELPKAMQNQSKK